MDVAGIIESYGYAAVAVGAMVEGETVLLAAGAAAFHDYLSLPLVIAIAAGTSFLGDQVFFLMGQRYGARVVARFPSLAPPVGRMRALLQRHHVPLILGLRFMYGLRMVGPVAIGMSGVPWSRFLALNLLSAMAWASLIGSLGYSLGKGLDYLFGDADKHELWLLAIAVASLLGWLLYRQLRQAFKRRAGKPQPPSSR